MTKKKPTPKPKSQLCPIDKVGNAWLKYMHPDASPREAILRIERRLNNLGKLEEELNKPTCAKAPDPVRVRILNQGAELTQGERNKAYGNAVTNMQHMAGLLTAYFHNLIRANPSIVVGYNLKDMPEAHYTFTGEDAAQIMAIAKLSRTANRGVRYHEDNYTDQAVYSAMAGECADKERPLV